MELKTMQELSVTVARGRGRLQSSVRATLAAVAVVAIALTSLATPMASSATAGIAVPFVGVFKGTETVTPLPPFPPALLQVDGEWSGVASQLGWFTVTNPHIVKTSDRTATGSFAFRAANGDTLTADEWGQASLTGNPNVLAIVEHARITGGTGRFAGAAGTFTVKRLLAGDTGSTIGYFAGTISSH